MRSGTVQQTGDRDLPLLVISGLSVRFETSSEGVQAVEGIDLSLHRKHKIALIGESGCGKTVLALAVMRLLPLNAAIEGSIRYKGSDLVAASAEEMQQIRGRSIAMIPQNSVNSLNPVMSIGEQILESFRDPSEDAAFKNRARAEALLAKLGFDCPEDAMQKYPHQFSGGMRERILIAMALAGDPDFIIADEPTSGLDILVKTKILDLLREVFLDRTLLLITHDLGVASALASHLAVLYAGEIVEYGRTSDVLAYPLHPYTQGLLASMPSAGFHPIPGMSPAPGDMPPGCRFSSRCPSMKEVCRKQHPDLKDREGSHKVRCHRYD